MLKVLLNSWGTWVAWLVECLTLSFSSGHDLTALGLSPESASALSTESA